MFRFCRIEKPSSQQDIDELLPFSTGQTGFPMVFFPFWQAQEKHKVDAFVTLAEQRAGEAGVEESGALSFLSVKEETEEEPEPESLLNVLAEGGKMTEKKQKWHR